MIEGKRFKISNGKIEKTKVQLLKLCSKDLPYDKIHKKSKLKRLQTLQIATKKLAVDPEGHSTIFKDFLLHNKSLVIEAYKDPRLCQQVKKLTPQESLEYMISLGYTGRDYRRHITVLNKLGNNFLSSYKSIQCEKEKISQRFSFEKGSSLFFKNTKMNETVRSVFSKVVDLKGMVYAYLEDFKGKHIPIVF